MKKTQKIVMLVSSKGIILSEAYGEFLKYCKVKNLSQYTITYYDNCYKYFAEFYGENSPCHSINVSHIQDYVLYLKKTGINDITMNTYLRGVRAILYYFMKLDYTDRFKIELRRAEKHVKETYTDAELKLLLRKPELNKCSFAEYRDWTVINYLLSTGNRLQTLINIKIKDVNFEEDTIILGKTKNKRQQVIPLGHTMNNIFKEYLQYRKGEPEDYLFCNVAGEQLTRVAIEHSIRKYNMKRGVMKTSLHLFRNTFAKKWILAGGDIFRLQKMLGHSSLDMVKEYVNMFSDDLQQDFDKFNPLEQFNQSKGSFIKMGGKKR